MSKGGKQNVIPTDVRNEVNQMIADGITRDPCDAIAKLVDEAKSITNKKERSKRLENLDVAAKGYNVEIRVKDKKNIDIFIKPLCRERNLRKCGIIVFAWLFMLYKGGIV